MELELRRVSENPPNAPLKIHMEPGKSPASKKGYIFEMAMLIFRAKKTLQRDKSAISGICVNIGICHPLVMAMHETKIGLIGRVFENQTSIQAFSS